MVAQQPRLLPVLGMHRSGTSAAAGALQRLGAALGDEGDLMEGKPDNPKGFFEHEQLVQVDRAVLGALGGSWMRPPILVDGWHRDERLDRARGVARKWLESITEPEFVVKDPRLSLVLPFWRDLADLGPTLHVLRHPAGVAASLRRRNGMHPEASAELWLRHVVAVLRDAPDATVVRAEELVADPVAALGPYVARIGLANPADHADELRDFIDPEMFQDSVEPHDGPRTAAAVGLHLALVDGAKVDRNLLGALSTFGADVSPLPPGGLAASDVVIELRGAVGEARHATKDALARFARSERERVKDITRRDCEIESLKAKLAVQEQELTRLSAEFDRFRHRRWVRAGLAVADRLRRSD